MMQTDCLSPGFILRETKRGALQRERENENEEKKKPKPNKADDIEFFKSKDEGFQSKDEAVELIKTLHIKCGFLDTYNLYMLPKNWLKCINNRAVKVDLLKTFLVSCRTNTSFFVENEFKEWDPKSHGPRNFAQSFYIASLIHYDSNQKKYPLANVRNGCRQTRTTARKIDGIIPTSSAESSNSEKRRMNSQSSFKAELTTRCQAFIKRDKALHDAKTDEGVALTSLKSLIDKDNNRNSILQLERNMKHMDLPKGFNFFQVGRDSHKMFCDCIFRCML